jgi:hypothetical protein
MFLAVQHALSRTAGPFKMLFVNCLYPVYVLVVYDMHFILSGSLKVMLLCGSDLLESFSTPGVWIPDQVEILKIVL